MSPSEPFPATSRRTTSSSPRSPTTRPDLLSHAATRALPTEPRGEISTATSGPELACRDSGRTASENSVVRAERESAREYFNQPENNHFIFVFPDSLISHKDRGRRGRGGESTHPQAIPRFFRDAQRSEMCENVEQTVIFVVGRVAGWGT